MNSSTSKLRISVQQGAQQPVGDPQQSGRQQHAELTPAQRRMTRIDNQQKGKPGN